MIDHLLSFMAPHLCFGCGKSGNTLCDNCKYNIVSEPFGRCIVCLKPTGGRGLCDGHTRPYSRAWIVGERSETMEHLIDGYKFSRAKALHLNLADLLDATLPELPRGVIIAPIPTISTHVRQRGYDHTLLIAKELARRKGLALQRPLARQHSAKQLGASRSERIKQARTAFRLEGPIDPREIYLLIDDVYTTGATLQYGAQALRDAGVQDVWVAVLARQVSTEQR